MSAVHREVEEASLASYYKHHGYVVVPGLIPHERVDQLMALYERDVRRSNKRYFRQNTNRYEVNRRTSHGYVRQSFLDVHAYASHPEFQEAVLNIYFGAEMLKALDSITGFPKHNLMQSMLFDLNAATPPHQDWWYLDSVPNGELTAAWIALEDIDERAGRFYVLPGSQHTVLHEQGLPHSSWLERMRCHLEERQTELLAPALKKGDVLFWNSRTIHGAFQTKDERFSRKSLTAHYLPASTTFGNIFTSKPWVRYVDWNGHQYFANQPEYTAKAALISRLKVALYDHPTLLRVLRRWQRGSIADIDGKV